MGRCSVLGCRMKNNKKHPITLHRLPASKKQKEQWLDIIGLEVLNTSTKHIFICSLHFKEECFNRTLNVTRLRDDALPSSELLLPEQFDECEEQHSVTHRVCVFLEEEPVCSTSNYADLPDQFNECEEQKFVSHKALEEEPVCSTSRYEHNKALEIIKKLKSQVESQRKKIKRLNEQVRRQRKTINDFKTVMNDLKDKNM